MTEVLIYGASDDLIEVEGTKGLVQAEEYSTGDDGTVLLVGPTNEIVRVRCYMDDEGDWAADAKVLRASPGFQNVICETVPRPGTTGEPGDRAARISFEREGSVFAFLLDVNH